MRIESLTFFRFVAAMIVVIFHFGTNTQLAALAPGFLTAGSQFVTFFFVLSGFVLVIANPFYKALNARRFFYNRLIRITPLYLLALILSIFVFSDKNSITGILLNASYLQAWFPPYPLSVNSPAWSLSAEMFFYACFPLTWFLLKHYRATLTRIFIVTIGVWALSQAGLAKLIKEPFYQGFPSISFDLIHYFPLAHLPGFVLGMVAGQYYLSKNASDKPASGYNPLWLGISMLIIYLALEYKDAYSSLEGFSAPLHAGFYTPLFAVFIFLLASSKTALSRFLGSKPLSYLGEISYGIYILQMPLYSLYHHLMGGMGLNGDMLFYTYCIFLIVVSSLLHHAYDKPLQRLLKNKL